MDSSDRDLLHRFTHQRDEAAFRELVMRYLALVHGTACRVTASEDLAKDAAQNTFIRLARRATLIPPDIALASWLHRTCRSIAIDLVRAESTRRKLEMKAVSSPHHGPDSEPSWARLSPVIDSLISQLAPADREAVLLRFFQDLTYSEVGLHLGLSEEAARKRTARAVEKLRVLLGKRGIATTVAALSNLLPAHAATLPSAALATSIFQATQGIAPAVPAGSFSHFLAMTLSHKSSLTFAALLLLATTAYTTPWRDPSPVAVAPKPASPIENSVRESARFPTSSLRNFPATADGRLARLHAVLEIEDAIERHREMIALIDSIPSSGLETLAEALLSMGRKDRDEERNLLLFAWTRADPEKALAAGARWKVSEPMVTYWATYAPEEALAWAEAHPAKSHPVLTDSNLHWYAALGGIAMHDPGRSIRMIQEKIAAKDYAPELQEAQPANAERLNGFVQLCKAMSSQTKPLELLRAGAGDEATRNEIVAAAAIATMGIQANPVQGDERVVEAVRQLLTYPAAASQNQETAGAYTRAFGDWAEIDRPAAIEALAAAPANVQEATLNAVASRISGTDFPGAIDILNRFPPERSRAFIGEFVQQSLQGIPLFIPPTDPAVATDQFLRLQDESLRNEATLRSLNLWLKKDASAARGWIADHSLPDAIKSQLPQN